jgi:hypothetical protein
VIKTQYDAATNTTIEVQFDENDLKQLAKDQAVEAARLADLEVKAAAKAAVLDRLGLTADEAALLLS